MKLYDTKMRQVIEVTPAKNNLIDIYCCGPTVYRFAHVGNFRTFLLGDFIRRTLNAEGKKFRYIQNITDVGHLNDDTNIEEDKILMQAKLESKSPFAIAEFYEKAFHQDSASLNILPADSYPKASQSISLITDLIAQLIYLGNAYQGSDGSLYFSAQSCKDYGAISGNSLEHLQAGHRFDPQQISESGKRFHADWALWKGAGADREMIWQTPWGSGFPGWHIECSAMSLHYFPDGISLHLGGIDLRFPHHENERAQSNSATNSEFVQLWIHGEHLLFEGKKMAKSSGNVLHVADLIARKIDPLALRLLFLENHYRSQMNLTWASIYAAFTTLKRWRRKIIEWPDGGQVDDIFIKEIVNFFSNDLDSHSAIMQIRAYERNESVARSVKRATLLAVDKLLGLELDRTSGGELSPEISQLLEERAELRAAKNWSGSDELREKLKVLGILVTDGVDGQGWEFI